MPLDLGLRNIINTSAWENIVAANKLTLYELILTKTDLIAPPFIKSEQCKVKI